MTNCVRLFGHWFHLVLQLSLKGTAFPAKPHAVTNAECWLSVWLVHTTDSTFRIVSSHLKAQPAWYKYLWNHKVSPCTLDEPWKRPSPKMNSKEIKKSRGSRIRQLKKNSISHLATKYRFMNNAKFRWLALVLFYDFSPTKNFPKWPDQLFSTWKYGYYWLLSILHVTY